MARINDCPVLTCFSLVSVDIEASALLINPDDFEQARQARDPHFDGRVFIGVLTTGIYCRPVCPVRLPLKENIRLYSTAAAAAEAGFRPCLRTRRRQCYNTGGAAWHWAAPTYAAFSAASRRHPHRSGQYSAPAFCQETN